MTGTDYTHNCSKIQEKSAVIGVYRCPKIIKREDLLSLSMVVAGLGVEPQVNNI